jgi:hypothetical protein
MRELWERQGGFFGLVGRSEAPRHSSRQRWGELLDQADCGNGWRRFATRKKAISWPQEFSNAILCAHFRVRQYVQALQAHGVQPRSPLFTADCRTDRHVV